MRGGGRADYYNDGNDEDEYESSGRSGRHSQRGFAAMDPEEHREISARGGRASHGGRRGRSQYNYR